MIFAAPGEAIRAKFHAHVNASRHRRLKEAFCM
jgi:hypothetical protein